MDLLVVPGFISHLDLSWAMPTVMAMFRRLASFSRLILFDKAGTGISGPIAHVPTLEQRMDEVNAVLDAAGSERAALLGLSEGGLMSVLFAATYPERTRALALYGAFPAGPTTTSCRLSCASRPSGSRAEMMRVVEHWGEGRIRGDKRSWNLGFFERPRLQPGDGARDGRGGQQLDVRPALGAVDVPTVVVHRSDDPFPIGVARWMAGRIPGARFVELPGDMHPMWRGDMDAVLDEVEALVPTCLQRALPRGCSRPSCPSTPAGRATSSRTSSVSAGAGSPAPACSQRSTAPPGRPLRHAIAGVRPAGRSARRRLRDHERGARRRDARRCQAPRRACRPGRGARVEQRQEPGGRVRARFVDEAAESLDPGRSRPRRSGGSPHRPRRSPCGRPTRCAAGERARLLVARYAPGLGRLLSRAVVRVRARLR